MGYDEGEEISVTCSETGQTREGKRKPRGAQLMKNGQRSNDYVESTLRVYDYMKVAIAILLSFSGIVAAYNQYILMPQVERAIREAVAPINARTAETASAASNTARDVEQLARRQWTIYDQKLYMALLQRENLKLEVPEPRKSTEDY